MEASVSEQTSLLDALKIKTCSKRVV